MSTVSEPVYSAVWSTDARGICISSLESPAGLIPLMKGVSLSAWLGVVQADDDARIAMELAAALEHVAPFNIEVPIQCTDGATRRVMFSGLPSLSSGTSQGQYSGFILDITGQRRALEDALRAAAEYRLLVENSTDLIAHCDTNGRYISVSPSYSKMIGWSAEEMVGRFVVEFLHPDDQGPAKDALAHLFNGGVVPDVVEVRKQHRDGHFITLGTKACCVSDPSTGHSIGAVLVSRDITREKLRLVELEKLASCDPLTGLSNRACISERVHSMLLQREDHIETAVLFIDLNGFKAVNDSLGHAAGDALLLKVSQRLQGCMRCGDVIGRMGGDEFVVASKCGDRNAATVVAQRLLDSLKAPFDIHGAKVQVGASIGISLSGPSVTTATVLFEHADLAMYRAKARRDGSYEVYEPATGPIT
ncbi:diguanylate cyclase domain-containing protein [Pseudomonas oryzihabitans]|uniref:diguanylate cyclase domain-containing protein n=1 Tax=Pseudomonas oryzihabitans TaxID=47885 RepID=UPI003EBEAB3A